MRQRQEQRSSISQREQGQYTQHETKCQRGLRGLEVVGGGHRVLLAEISGRAVTQRQKSMWCIINGA